MGNQEESRLVRWGFFNRRYEPMNTDERGLDFICVYRLLSAVKPTLLLFPVDGFLITSRLKKESFEHVPIALLRYP